MKTFIAMVAATILTCSTASGALFTVATFADPSQSSADPLFTVNWGTGESAGTIDAGWAYGKTGLTLEFGDALGGVSYTNAWFKMDQLTITDTGSFGGLKLGKTGPGVVRFYQVDTTEDPVLVLEFLSASFSRYSLAAADTGFYATDVTITGAAVSDPLYQESFSFSFANVVELNDGDIDKVGFTATAAFNSSAVPEPTGLILLVMGGVCFLLRRRRK